MTEDNINPNRKDFSAVLADAAWQRLRSLALTTAKYDNFVQLGSSHMPENGESKKTAVGDYSTLVLAQDFLLMNIQESFEKENIRILLNLNDSVSTDELSSIVGFSELALREKLSAMAQCGLVVRDMESGKYSPSDNGFKLVGLISDSLKTLESKIKKELPEIIGGKIEPA